MICKNEKKNNVLSELVARNCSAKKVSLKFRKIGRETPVPESLSNTVTGLQDARLGALLQGGSDTGVSESTVRRCSAK